jgi:putative acyl-CoA dehydrogenase
MRNVLTDLCVESEAHTFNAFYVAQAFDRYNRGSNGTGEKCSEEERELFRIAVTVSKYYVTKRLPGFTYECMEAMGGNGFVEDFPMARLFRHSPLNSIWEGSGNVIALDILRGYQALPTLMADIGKARGADKRFDDHVASLQASINLVMKDPMGADTQRAARNIVDRLALALQASVLLRRGDNKVHFYVPKSTIFCAVLCYDGLF